MNLLTNLVYLPSLIGICIVALATFINRNARGATFFGIFLIAVASWLMPQYVVQVTGGTWHGLLLIRLATFFSAFIALSFLLFIISYTKSLLLSKRQVVLYSSPILLLSLSAFTNLGVRHVKASSAGIAITDVGYMYFIMMTLVVLYLLAALFLLFAQTTKLSASQRSKNYTLMLGLLQAIVIVSINVSVFADSQKAQIITPLSLFIMSAIVAFTILKHRLFNIQLVIARTLAYVLVISVSAILFVFLVFGTSSVFTSLTPIPKSLQAIYTAAALIIAFVLPLLKRFFDKLTNRVFYRDAYDASHFLNEFNKILVSTYSFEPLLQKSAKIIEANLKPTFVLFGIKETSSTPRRLIGTKNMPAFSESDIAYVRSQTYRIGKKIIITDQLESKNEQLKEILQLAGVSVIARLTTGKKYEEGAGYLVLGVKKSGNPYNSHDIRLIEILSNELVIAVQNALRFEEIQAFNKTLQEKVNHATLKLRRTNQKLKELDETKDDFISMASHQLRTPLTSVKGYISMVLEEDAGKINPMQREMLGQAFFSSQRMVYLIADLLNVSRLKTGKFVIEATKVNLATIIEQELKQLEETAAARSLTLQFDKPDNFPDAMLDETKTRQVIMNFVDNAIYYTPSGGHIRVELRDTPTSVEMRVIDDGIGVSKHEQPHLFTKFFRAGNARQARPDGTGLGLFMAKKVIVAQQGALIFESEEGKGSTFGFTFAKDKVGIQPQVLTQTPAKEPVA